jgi:hypothetical protein
MNAPAPVVLDMVKETQMDAEDNEEPEPEPEQEPDNGCLIVDD